MIHIILNPGIKGNGLKTWNKLESDFIKSDIKYTLYKTQYDKHATQIASQITSNEDSPTIIVIGGDGTLNEVINGIQNLDKPLMMFIPSGSGCDFIRGMRIDFDLDDVIYKIQNPEVIRYVDIGTTTFNDTTKRFIISSGIGYDASVCHEATSRSLIKRVLNKLHLGKLTYRFIALKQLFTTPYFDSTITIDGEGTHYNKTIFSAAMNLPFEGGGFMFCPNAKYNSSKLSYIVANNYSKLAMLFVIPFAYFGKHAKFTKNIHLGNANNITIHSNKTMAIHCDGEPVGHSDNVSFSLENKKLRFII